MECAVLAKHERLDDHVCTDFQSQMGLCAGVTKNMKGAGAMVKKKLRQMEIGFCRFVIS